MTEPARAYATAGVDVAAAERVVELLRSRLSGPSADLLGQLSGFAAAVPLPEGYRRPVLVSATDGVGTKTEIARLLGRVDTIGQDLVAMCADDVVCHGARPLFFLDYVAVGRLDPKRLALLVDGIARACSEIGCELVGGETAEHPGVMEPDAFDLAGFCLGVVERELLLDGSGCRAGDVLLGLASSGLHANGYSLVRALIARHALQLAERLADVVSRHGLEPDTGAGDESLGEALLRPARLYAASLLELRDQLLAGGMRLGGFAHITGGGLSGNVPRCLPPDLAAAVHIGSWPEPAIFGLFSRLARMEPPEARATFNSGIGMVAVVEPAAVDAAVGLLSERGIVSWPIGEVVPARAPSSERYLEVA